MTDLILIVAIILIIIVIIIVIGYFSNRKRNSRVDDKFRFLARKGNKFIDRYITERRQHDSSSSDSSFNMFNDNEYACPQISPPVITVSYDTTTMELDISWTNTGAEDYTIEVIGQTNSTDIKIQNYSSNQIYVPVPVGNYNIFVTPVTGDCFGTTGKSVFITPCFPSCAGVTPFCNGTTCVECLTNSNCSSSPSTPFCNNGTCAECLTNNDCPISAPFCNLGTCVECTTNSECLPGATCVGTTCVCPIPVVTGITISAPWPNDSPWTFNITGAPSTGNTFTFGWKVYGTAGPTMPPVSGYAPDVLLPNNQFDAGAESPAVDSCNDSVGYGCSNAGCSTGDTVTFDINELVVTNPCGQSSISTCWILVNPCAGGNLNFTQITCPAP
jgi:type II secretory pathway pseudopilin PulG